MIQKTAVIFWDTPNVYINWSHMISNSKVPSIFVPGIYICSMIQKKTTDLTVAIMYCKKQWYIPILRDKFRVKF